MEFIRCKIGHGANFFGAEFQGLADFSDSNLVGPSFIGSKFKKIDFSTTNIESGNFRSIQVKGDSNFIGTKFDKVTFIQASFEGGTDFTNSIFNKSNCSMSKFHNVNFSNSNLDVVNFNRK